MTSVSTVEARHHFADVINHAYYSKERIVLSRHRKDIVAIIPIEDLELLEALEDTIDIREARAAIREMKKKGAISWDEIKEKYGL